MCFHGLHIHFRNVMSLRTQWVLRPYGSIRLGFISAAEWEVKQCGSDPESDRKCETVSVVTLSKLLEPFCFCLLFLYISQKHLCYANIPLRYSRTQTKGEVIQRYISFVTP